MQSPKLISIVGGNAGTALDVSSEKQFSIGRALQNSYIIEDVLVSRHHCTIEVINGRWTILDTSINGTHLNNILIGKNNRKNLEHGDIIMLTSNVKFKFELREVLPDDDEFVAIAEAVMDSVDIAKGAIETADVTQVVAPKKCESRGLSSKLDEDDLTCSVCTELFIEAVTLGCSHTFCKFCIEQWRKNDDVCPICRTKIKGQFPTLIINNLVEKYLMESSDAERTRRKEIIEERLKLQAPQPPCATDEPGSSNTTTIEITSDDDDIDDVYEFEGGVFFFSDGWEDGYNTDAYYYNGLPGAYYGGYGSCYTCGERGHWANGCPANPRRRHH